MARWLLCALLVALSSSASAAPRRVAVTQAAKGWPQKVERTITRVLDAHDGVERIPDETWQTAAERLGLDDRDPNDRATIAEEARATAVLVPRTARMRRRYVLKLELYDGRDGKKIDTLTLRAKRSTRLRYLLKKRLWRWLAPRLDKLPAPAEPVAAAAPPPPEAAPPPEPPPPPPPEPEAPAAVSEASTATEASPAGPSGAALDVQVGFATIGRNLSYTDDLFRELRGYALAGAPAVRSELRWYPGAHVTSAWAAHLGVQASFLYALALESEAPDGTSFDTSTWGFEAAARGRLPLGRHEIGLALGGGLHRFGFAAAGDSDPDIPDTSYGFLRAGLDGRFFVSEALSLRPAFGWRQVLSSGEIRGEDWFENGSALAFDASLDVGYRIWRTLEVRARGDFVRYALDFDVEPDDARVAGGAVDQYWGATLSLAWYLDGR